MTPKQAFHMLKAYGRERADIFEAVGVMIGGKSSDRSSEGVSIDTTSMDKIAEERLDKLNREAKVG